MLDKAAVKQVQPSDVYPVWEIDRWDGMSAGYATYADKSRLVYLRREDQGWDETGKLDEEGEPIISFWSIYAVYTITEEEAQRAKERHAVFQRYVGTHCDYDGKAFDEAVRVGSVAPSSEHHKFYEAQREIKTSKASNGLAECWFETRAEY